MKLTYPTDLDKREVPAKILLVVAGSRNYNNYRDFSRYLNDYIQLLNCQAQELVLVTGQASRGPDNMVIAYADEHGYDWVGFPAQWQNEYGQTDRGAGYRRNAQMAQVSTHALIFWDSMSKGTKHMLGLCRQRQRAGQMKCFLIIVDPDHAEQTQLWEHSAI